jgi:CheY-like chemotaxis protein
MAVSAPLILVVDDQEQLVRYVTRLLEREGYAVATAANGKQAVEYLSGDRDLPNLILLDLVMPVMNGWQFLEWIHGNGWVARIPVIAMTGQSGLDNAMATLGTAACLFKPLDSAKLLATIAEHVPVFGMG